MTSLDEQLALSSPPVPARSPELDAEFVRVVAHAEGAARPRLTRRRRAVAIGGLVAVGALGSGGAAAGLIPWFASAPSHGVVTTSTGTRCDLTFGAKHIDDPAAPVSDAVRAKAKAAAEKYLSDFDVSALSLAQATQAAGPRPTVDSEAGPAMTVDEYEVQAVYDEVDRRVDAELARQHLPSSAVGLSMASSCDGGDQ